MSLNGFVSCSYEEFRQVLSLGHRLEVAKMYDESEQLSLVSIEDAKTNKAADEVLQNHGIVDTIKTSVRNFGHIKI